MPGARRPTRHVEEDVAPDGEDGVGDDDWLVTYTDMVTLLLTFFVLLVSFSTFDPERRSRALAGEPDVVVASLPGTAPFALGFPHVPSADADPDAEEDAPEAPAPSSGAADVARRIDDLIRRGGLAADVEVIENPGGVTVRMAERILFSSGRAVLEPSGSDLVSRLAPMLAAAGGTISVEGHTDDVPIANRHFTSNWELSAARALVVLQELTAHGVDPGAVRAVAYGESRPVADNSDPEGRARNRRVELLVQETGR